MNKDHASAGPSNPIDDYIAAQPESVQPFLELLHATLRAALPGTEERIAWKMPTYWREHNVMHFAAYKNHVNLYPGAEAIEHFAERLGPYKRTKGAVQFPYSQPLPLELIADIAKWCYETGHHH